MYRSYMFLLSFFLLLIIKYTLYINTSYKLLNLTWVHVAVADPLAANCTSYILLEDGRSPGTDRVAVTKDPVVVRLFNVVTVAESVKLYTRNEAEFTVLVDSNIVSSDHDVVPENSLGSNANVEIRVKLASVVLDSSAKIGYRVVALDPPPEEAMVT